MARSWRLSKKSLGARRREFLTLNPAGTLPVLLAEGDVPIVGAVVIAEYLDETRGVLKRDRRLFAEDPIDRAEIRRLTDWYLQKTEGEVTRHLVRERGSEAADAERRRRRLARFRAPSGPPAPTSSSI